MAVLKTPIITEKMTADSERNNRYGFIVDRKANKVEIKKAIEQMYGVTVGKVRTMNYIGKPRTRNTKSGVISGRTKPFKKAVVSLSEGDNIDFFSNI